MNIFIYYPYHSNIILKNILKNFTFLVTKMVYIHQKRPEMHLITQNDQMFCIDFLTKPEFSTLQLRYRL